MDVKVAKKKRELNISSFMSLFIVALVMRGKHKIYIRKERAIEERRRMHTLHEYLNERVEKADRSDPDWLHFILRLRNQLSPGNIGSFDGFYGLIADKQLTLVSLDFPYGEYFSFDSGETHARSLLKNGDVELRELAEKCADVYVAKIERER